MAPVRAAARNELLEATTISKTPSILDIRKQSAVPVKHKKPSINKPSTAQDLKAKLSSFLPELKAANDALPADTSAIEIENVDDSSRYIEMDLGLGVLEEKHSDESASDTDTEQDRDVMSKLLHTNPVKAGAITVVEEDALPPSALLCDPVLEHYRRQSLPEMRFEMDIVLSLMSRILVQLRKHRGTQSVDTITKLNVLREDMYKLMSRRDRLIETDEGRLRHESAYLDELDAILT